MAMIPLSYNLRSIKVRWTSTIVALMSIAIVVGIFTHSLLNLSSLNDTIYSVASEDNVIVLRDGATSEMMSAMGLEQGKIISNAPGVAKDANGDPLASMETPVVRSLPLRFEEYEADVVVRGVSDNVFNVRDKVRLIEGRFFNPGVAELVVGKQAAENYKDLEIGGSATFNEITYTVVGIFDSDGSTLDSEIWCDAALFSQSFGTPTPWYRTVIVKLNSPEAFNEFKDSLSIDNRLNVKAERETEYYGNIVETYTKGGRITRYIVLSLLALGAIFAALNTMYTTVSARSSEIATMRALGFRGNHILISFLAESLCIALLGWLLGYLFMFLVFNGLTHSTLFGITRSFIIYEYQFTPLLMFQGLIFALVMGFFGGFLPALRAARQPIAATLRAM